jgi:hypothetical protein
MLRHAAVVLWSAVGLCVSLACAPAQSLAPVAFADLRADEVTHSWVRLRFTTSVPTTCEAEYGKSPDALDQTAVDPSMEEGELDADHDIIVDGLQPNTEYHWRASATDADGNHALSEVLTFTTLPMPDDGDLNYSLADNGGTIRAVSSNFGGAANDATWGVNNAVDGRQSTQWATAGDGDDAWFEIAVSGLVLNAVVFRSREMSDGSSIITSFQLLDADGDRVGGPFDTPDPDVTYRFDIDPPATVGLVRFEAVTTTGGNTGLRDLELWGPGP